MFLVLFLKRTLQVYSLWPRRANVFGSFFKKNNLFVVASLGPRRATIHFNMSIFFDGVRQMWLICGGGRGGCAKQ
jgi:hypothetical protein